MDKIKGYAFCEKLTLRARTSVLSSPYTCITLSCVIGYAAPNMVMVITQITQKEEKVAEEVTNFLGRTLLHHPPGGVSRLTKSTQSA